MAQGYPDFFGYQIIPKYGTPVQEQKASTVVASGVDETVFNITGKGRTYGGYVQYWGTLAVFVSTVIYSVIDGVNILFFNPEDQLDFGLNMKESQPFSLTQYEYDGTTKYVCYACHKDWTFGQSFQVILQNGSGANVNVRGRLYWGRMI